MIDSAKYRIVYCVPALYGAGGIERVLTVKANYLAEVLKYDITIILTEGDGTMPFFPLSTSVKIVNLNIDFEELSNRVFFMKVFGYIRKQIKYKHLLRNELVRISPDITISVLRREINFLHKIKDGSKKIGELHVNRAHYRSFDNGKSSILKNVFSYYWKKKLVKDLKKLDRLVVLTEIEKNNWPELNNIIVIPNPLPFHINCFFKSDLESKRVVAIGRYSSEKGYDLLLKSWALIEKSCVDWRLDIYGDGNRQLYELLIDNLNIDRDRCCLHGATYDVRSIYSNSSICVVSSRYEGFCMSIIESMACGVPVVSFNCTNGPGSIIDDGVNGFLVPEFDIRLFSEKVLALVDDKSMRVKMGENACRIAESYELEIIGCAWNRLFDELFRS